LLQGGGPFVHFTRENERLAISKKRGGGGSVGGLKAFEKNSNGKA